MKKVIRKSVAFAMSLMLGVGLLAGCTGGGDTGKTDGSKTEKPTSSQGDETDKETDPADLEKYTPVGEYPISNEVIEMEMFSMSAPNIIDWATNDFTLYMEEKTNVHWSFVQAPADGTGEMITILMASDAYPDAFMFSTPNIPQYGVKEQMLLPLDELIPQYMPNYYGFMEENPAYWNQQKQTDGHIYGVASVNVCYHCSHFNKLWVNMDYIEEIGLGVPETTEEFTEVVKAYMDLYPNGVPITGSTNGWGEQFINFLSGSFITNPGRRSSPSGSGNGDRLLVSPDGEIVTQAAQDEWREFLKFMRDLYDLGAIYDGGFTQNPDQYRALVNQEDSPALFIASGAISNSVSADENPDLYKAFRAVAPFEGPDGTKISTHFKYNDLQENKFVLTDVCKDPQAALRWADHFYTLEGYLQYQYGDNTDGNDWVLEPEGAVGLDGTPALYEVLNHYSAEAQNHDWQDCGLIFAPEWVRFGEATDANVDIGSSAGLEKLLMMETREKYEPYAQDPATQFDVIPSGMKLTTEESDSIQTIAVELESYIDTNTVAFITGERDVNSDSEWDAYIAGFDSLGMADYLKVFQDAWNRMTAN